MADFTRLAKYRVLFGDEGPGLPRAGAIQDTRLSDMILHGNIRFSRIVATSQGGALRDDLTVVATVEAIE